MKDKIKTFKHKKNTSSFYYVSNIFIQHHFIHDTMIKLRDPTTWYYKSVFVNNNVSQYVALQKHIAQVQPIEEKRPMVYLHVYSKQHSSNSIQPTIYLLGGMGPLSDSHFISQLYKKIKRVFKTYNIHLFSIPPPRSLLSFQKIYSYTSQLQWVRECIQSICKNQEIFLISNAAHTYRHILSSFYLPTFNMIPHLQHNIEKMIRQSSKNTKFLILSTKHVYLQNMYSKMFPLNAIIELSSSQVIKIQMSIDQIKQNCYNYNINPIQTFIQSMVNKYKVYHIHAILACTELSIWYNTQKKSSGNYNNYKIIDISSIMQDIIVDNIHNKN